MTDRYAVVGNPVAHSKTPDIHAAFARATGHDLSYERLLSPLDGFIDTVSRFQREGGRGLNVTVPFKIEAFALAREHSLRAQRAGACNTLAWRGTHWFGDNTDGAGLVRDLDVNFGVALGDHDILVLGAGGAARGIIAPLLDARPRSLTISNRTMDKAQALARAFAGLGPIRALAPQAVAGRHFDVVLNATSSSLASAAAGSPPWPGAIFAGAALAYDLMYGNEPTAFEHWAHANGAARVADGFGMLLEQAAESFLVWRGVRPDTAPVYALLRGERERSLEPRTR
jgi:shikimate dehydrogenase